MDDIEKAIKGEDKGNPAPEPGDKPKEEQKPSDADVRAREEKSLAEIEAAKAAALAELQTIRAEKRQVKKEQKAPEAEVEKVIDENDPDAKPWIKRINESVSPVQEELEKEKAEILAFSVSEFMQDKPALSKNPDKVKELMQTYERIRTASGRTKEGVLLDLDKAYAATFHKELLDVARQNKVQNARNDALFSDIAVNRGSTAYSAPKEEKATLTDDERLVLAKWGMSEQEWVKMRNTQKEKASQG